MFVESDEVRVVDQVHSDTLYHWQSAGVEAFLCQLRAIHEGVRFDPIPTFGHWK